MIKNLENGNARTQLIVFGVSMVIIAILFVVADHFGLVIPKN